MLGTLTTQYLLTAGVFGTAMAHFQPIQGHSAWEGHQSTHRGHGNSSALSSERGRDLDSVIRCGYASICSSIKPLLPLWAAGLDGIIL